MVGHIGYQREIMGDEQHGHPAFLLQLLEQVHDLRLKTHIECGRWLIGNQKFGFSGKRHGNHDSLLLTAG